MGAGGRQAVTRTHAHILSQATSDSQATSHPTRMGPHARPRHVTRPADESKENMRIRTAGQEGEETVDQKG